MAPGMLACQGGMYADGSRKPSTTACSSRVRTFRPSFSILHTCMMAAWQVMVSET